MRVECYVQESYVQGEKDKLLFKRLEHEVWTGGIGRGWMRTAAISEA